MNEGQMKLGINGLGRIGKLSVWHHVGRRYFNEIVVNIGRPAGTGLTDIAHYLERDSTYGALHAFLHGYQAKPVITDIDDSAGTMVVDGITLRILRTARTPQAIDWKAHGVRLVVDTTGQFLDPTLPVDHPKGSVRGHLEAGAEKVVVSAPFKIKDEGVSMPNDAVTTVMGINANDYDPRRHRVISNASCTTTCLAHMMKPLINAFGAKRVLSASMATIHAATGSQQVLDRLPAATGAAKALRLVIPEMEHIGFIAESVRVPVTSGSLIILVLSIQESPSEQPVRRGVINSVYDQAAQLDPNGYLKYTEKQNVSGDILGSPQAAAVIEGDETHTRTADLSLDLASIPGFSQSVLESLTDTVVRAPVTQAVIYGWYDNEMGSYVNMLGDRTVTIAENM
jgi:glyceraldehyde 3-phosphate dehydrogenase